MRKLHLELGKSLITGSFLFFGSAIATPPDLSENSMETTSGLKIEENEQLLKENQKKKDEEFLRNIPMSKEEAEKYGEKITQKLT